MRTPPGNVIMVLVEGTPDIRVFELEESAIACIDNLVRDYGIDRVRVFQGTITQFKQLEVVRENAYLRPVQGAPS